jgi:hypothetical protein
MSGSVQPPAGFQIRIALRDILPPIWRRFQVPGAIALPSLAFTKPSSSESHAPRKSKI